MAKWSYFAAAEFPHAVRELELPAATGRPDLERCPLHGEPVGTVTHLCKACFDVAWAEVGRRYVALHRDLKTRKETNHMNDDGETTAVLVDVDENDQLPAVQPVTSLFLTNDPETFLARAQEAAAALDRVIRDRKLYTTIRGRDHVHVEGWTLLGSLLGVFPITEWTRPIEDGWEARVVARTRAGELVGAAESMCLRKESKWRSADDYAIRSMAATRATSKALRLPLGFIVELAGFDPCPAEELTADEPRTEQKPPVGAENSVALGWQ
jgi:hypothetical protein